MLKKEARSFLNSLGFDLFLVQIQTKKSVFLYLFYLNSE